MLRLRVILLLSMLGLVLCASSCKKVVYPSIFDMVDYSVGVSLDPGRLMINGRLYAWNPLLSDIQWAFGRGTAKSERVLVYENIGLIVQHNEQSVASLEFLYDELAGDYPCNKPFQGSLFVNGLKIHSDLKQGEIEEMFSEYTIIKSPGRVRVLSKAETLLVVPSNINEDLKLELIEIINREIGASIDEIVYIDIDEIADHASMKLGYYEAENIENKELKALLENNLHIDEYKMLYRHAIAVEFFFDTESKLLTQIVVKIGTGHIKRIEFF
jgi:hypothetical protein